MEQRLFSSPMLGIGTLQVAVDVPRPNKWYRPSGKDTLLICLAALLYEMPSRGMGTERSHTASCRYKVSPSRRRPCWHTGHTAPGSLPATSGVLKVYNLRTGTGLAGLSQEGMARCEFLLGTRFVKKLQWRLSLWLPRCS